MKKEMLRIICLSLLVVLVGSCKTGPKLTFCVIDAQSTGLQCSDGEGRGFFLPLSNADNYACLSPEDAKSLLTFCYKGPKK